MVYTLERNSDGTTTRIPIKISNPNIDFKDSQQRILAEIWFSEYSKACDVTMQKTRKCGTNRQMMVYTLDGNVDGATTLPFYTNTAPQQQFYPDQNF